MNLLLVRYVLVAAARDKLMWAMAAVIILGACLSTLTSSAAIIEQGQFVLTYMGGGLRIISLVGLTLFTVFFVRRLHDSRDIEFLLTRPVSRLSLVLSQSAAFSLLAVFSGGLLMGILSLLMWKQGGVGSVWLWSAGITFEFIIVANVAFFFSMVLTSPVTAGMATFGFYVLARMTGQLLAITHVKESAEGVGLLMTFFKGVMQVISVVIPRFDLMAQTSWLLYGAQDVGMNFLCILLQASVFLFLILTAIYIDLRRRQF